MVAVLRFNGTMFVDRAGKALNFKVTVRGERAAEWLRSVAQAIGAPAAPDAGELLMLPLVLPTRTARVVTQSFVSMLTVAITALAAFTVNVVFQSPSIE